MANELNRKVVLIRKKPEELKVEQLAKPTPDELHERPQGGWAHGEAAPKTEKALGQVARGESWAAACAVCDRHRALESIRCQVLRHAQTECRVYAHDS